MKKTILSFAAVLALTGSAQAADLTVPHTFSPGAPIKSADMNANFTALTQAIGGIPATVANSANGYIRIGNIQIIYGSVVATQSCTGKNIIPVTFAVPFTTNPKIFLTSEAYVESGFPPSGATRVAHNTTTLNGFSVMLELTNINSCQYGTNWMAIGTWK